MDGKRIIPTPFHQPDDHFVLEGGWLSVHARWASHSGYLSLGDHNHDRLSELDDQAIECIGEELYQQAKAMPFLVGRWDTSEWSVLRNDVFTDRLQFRLPQWAESAVKVALTEVSGAEETCKINGFWCFPAGISKERARGILAPLLSMNTRLEDQTRLAAMIRSSDEVLAHSFTSAQFSLFD